MKCFKIKSDFFIFKIFLHFHKHFPEMNKILVHFSRMSKDKYLFYAIKNTDSHRPKILILN